MICLKQIFLDTTKFGRQKNNWEATPSPVASGLDPSRVSQRDSSRVGSLKIVTGFESLTA